MIGFIAAYLLPKDVWLVMEYCVGTATDLMKMGGRVFNEQEIATILGETLKGFFIFFIDFFIDLIDKLP